MTYRYRYETTLEGFPIHFDLFWNEAGKLVKIKFCEAHSDPISNELPYGIAAIVRDLKGYFNRGEPLLPFHWSMADVESLSEFSKKVYDAVLCIPHGETRTYSWVAMKLGKPLATRAVGQALKRNPFPIVVPCHRVVADKSIGGFMGCTKPSDFELRFKNWLLEVERSFVNPSFSFMTRKNALNEITYN